MNFNINKNYKLLSLFNLTNVEKYLQEIVNLSFEYSSNFIFNYNINDFKNFPLLKYEINQFENEILDKFIYLLNTYIEKDCFFSSLYLYFNFKFKIKFNHFIQILGLRGDASIKNFKCYIFSNLNYGLTFKDFILSSFKTRESIIDSSVNISSSGYLTRKLVESLRDINIKELKCYTKYNIINTYNNEFLNIPFLCLNNKSVCSFCMNIFYKYNMFMGYNKGVVSGQALGEPSTQMLLRTFHLGAGNIAESGSNVCSSTSLYNINLKINNIYYKSNLYKFKNYNYNINLNTINYNCFIILNFYNSLNKFMYSNKIEFLTLIFDNKKLWNLISFYKNIFNYKNNTKDYKNCSKQKIYYIY